MRYLPIFLIASIMTLLSGCQLVGDIFKAGVWAGILFVVVIVGIIIFIVGKLMGGK